MAFISPKLFKQNMVMFQYFASLSALDIDNSWCSKLCLFFFEKINCVKVIDIHYRKEKQKYFFLSTWREVFVKFNSLSYATINS